MLKGHPLVFISQDEKGLVFLHTLIKEVQTKKIMKKFESVLWREIQVIEILNYEDRK